MANINDREDIDDFEAEFGDEDEEEEEDPVNDDEDVDWGDDSLDQNRPEVSPRI